ncbi:MAG: TniQ family protein [Thiobacillus sp.]
MMIPRDAFLIRPERDKGESLVGYLNRFHWENGLATPSDFSASVRDLYNGGVVRIEGLKYSLGADCVMERDGLLTRMGNAPPMNHGQPDWLKRSYNPIHYCPVCLRTKAVHADLWTMPMVHACPEHGCNLLSRCVVCGKSLAWSNLKPNWRCQCGALIAEAKSPRAKAWAVQLANEISQVIGVSAEMPCPSNAERIRAINQLYAWLVLANRLRRSLKRKILFQPETYWLPAASPSSLSSVGHWEARLLFVDADAQERLVHRLIRWDFRMQSGVLVTYQEGGPLATVLAALGKSRGNRYADELRCALERVLGRYRVDIPAWRDMFFNPRLSSEDVRFRQKRLSTWWHGLAQGIPLLDPGSGLHQVVGQRCQRSETVKILNTLFAASHRNDDVGRYSKLKARWQLPADLRRALTPQQALPELARYFEQLRVSEILFVSDLLDDVEGR